MLSQVDWRRVATATGVLLLHLIILLALLNVTGVIRLRDETPPKEIMLTLAPPGRPHVQMPVLPEQPLPIPYAPLPFTPRAITEPPPQTKPSQQPGDMGAVGRYLFNCSGGYYEQMTQREKEHCLSNIWNNERKPTDKPPVLGKVQPSPFDQVIQQRNAPVDTGFKQCDPASINASLHNVPCVDFSNSHSILNEVPGH